MEERTAEEIAQIFSAAGDSVTLINTDTAKNSNETEQEWKDRIKRNTDHLETIKAYKKEDGTIDEPTMYSIKGGGEWYDASYHGLLVHRNYEQKTVKVKVLKVKFQNLGENQAEAHFKWDHISGDYMPIEETNVDTMPWEVD